MLELRVKHVSNGSPRDTWIKDCVSKILRASTSSRGVGIVESDDPHVVFRYSGEPLNEDEFCFGSGSRNRYSTFKQPCLIDVPLVGIPLPRSLTETKLNFLDDGTMDWRAIVEDDDPRIDPREPRMITESSFFSGMASFEKVSHVVCVSASGNPMVSAKVAISLGCVVYASGWTHVDLLHMPRCGGIDDFLALASVMSTKNGSKHYFTTSQAPFALTAGHLTARDFRSVLGSSLKKRHGNDFTLLKHNVAETRLMETR